MTPAELLEAFAEKGLLVHFPHPPAPGRLAVTECTGAKLSDADAATMRAHKPALLAYLEREHTAAAWLDAQPRERRAAISRAAGAIARRTGKPAGEAWLEAVETAQAGAPTRPSRVPLSEGGPDINRCDDAKRKPKRLERMTDE